VRAALAATALLLLLLRLHVPLQLAQLLLVLLPTLP